LNELVTDVYVIAVWGGLAFIYMVALLDWNKTALKVALVGSLLMLAHHHSEGQSMNPTIRRGIPNIPVTEPKRAKWKFHCPVAIKQKDGACLATAIAQAMFIDGFEVGRQKASMYADELDKQADRYNINVTLGVAMTLGYVRSVIPVNSFEEYKEVIKVAPVLLGHDMFDGMTGIGDFFNGFVGPTGDRRGTKHVALLLGRNPHWLNGRYSTYKNSAGPDWGERFGEAKITDKELKRLWEIGNVEAWALIK